MSEIYRTVWPLSYGNSKQEALITEDVVYDDGIIVPHIKSLCWERCGNGSGNQDNNHVIQAKNSTNGRLVAKTVRSASLLGIADRLLQKAGYRRAHQYYPEQDAVFLCVEKPDGLGDASVLMFVNGVEPENGRADLLDIFPEPGDMVMVGYAGKPYWKGFE